MFDVPYKIPKEQYEFIRSLLETGKAENETLIVDMSELQSVTVNDGKVTFSPPINLTLKTGVLNLTTTLTHILNKKNGILFNINNSPIDLKVIPSE